MPAWTLIRSTPISCSLTALAAGSGTLIRSTASRTPYFRADRSASSIVTSDEAPRTDTMPAPAFAAISTSAAPVSIVFMSATIVFLANAFFSARTAFMPSLLISGVPASM